MPVQKRTMTRRDRAVLEAVTRDERSGRAGALLQPWRVLGDELFALYYQGKVDASSQKLVGVEALLRTRQNGPVSAGDAIALAERSGCIGRMGEWVASTACRQMGDWRRLGFRRAFSIAINVSAHQLQDAQFAARLLSAIQRARIQPRDIQIEVTETALIRDFDTAVRILGALREAGIKVAVDDFGTGHASLRYLTRLPVQQVKLDRSYVSQIGVSRHAETFIKALIRLADKLRLEVIGEGVETLEQVHYLRHHGCRILQGYYFSRPSPAAAITRRLVAEAASRGVRDDRQGTSDDLLPVFAGA